MSEKILVIPSRGLGDALIMLTLSYALRIHGCSVFTLHPHVHKLQTWFHEESFIPSSIEEISLELFKDFDHIFIQNDNSHFVNEVKKLRSQKNLSHITLIYPTYFEEKHGKLHSNDIVFNAKISMVANVEKMVEALTSLQLNKKNGIIPPPFLIHQKEKKRVILHPFSSEEKKNWPVQKFIKLAKEIENRGFIPHFIMEKPLLEIDRLLHKEKIAYSSGLPLEEIANLIYESGYVIGNDSFAAHLASNLHIPFLVLADCRERMKLWQPGWGTGSVVTIAASLKSFHYFKKNWQHFLSTRQVLKFFDKLCRTL